MTDSQVFTATKHALVFGWLSRGVIQREGQMRGEAIMRQAVRRYGEQRGRRMALRAKQDGQPLSMLSFLVYGEWQVSREEIDREKLGGDPHLWYRVHKCPWNNAWRENDLLPYGRLYCLEIDKALVRGFNPELRLDVLSTLSNQERNCEFQYHDAYLTPANEVLLAKQAIRNMERVILPWEYHTGHLFKTIGEVVLEQAGRTGQAALDETLAEFAYRFGQEAAHTIQAYSLVDFDCLPEEK